MSTDQREPLGTDHSVPMDSKHGEPVGIGNRDPIETGNTVPGPRPGEETQKVYWRSKQASNMKLKSSVEGPLTPLYSEEQTGSKTQYWGS